MGLGPLLTWANIPVRAAPPAITSFDLGLVDPEYRDLAVQIESFAGALPADDKALVALLRGYPREQVAARDDVLVRRESISGPAGPLSLLLINGTDTGRSRGGILHTHGGGYISGSAADDLRALQDLAAELDCAIVSVDYRVAPEADWRISTEENYAGLLWMHKNAAQLGVDPARIALLGESAGGGHAALLAIRARDRGQVPVLFQALTYPMLDDRTGSSRNPPAHQGALLWNSRMNRLGWSAFLGMPAGTAKSPADAVPSRVDDVSGLPPTFIGVGTLDLFVDENIEFARRLSDAKVPTELVVLPGVFHGFDRALPKARAATRFNAAKVDALRCAFAYR